MDRFIEDCAALENADREIQKRIQERLQGYTGNLPPKAAVVETANYAFMHGAATWARYLRDGKSVDDFIKKYASEAQS